MLWLIGLPRRLYTDNSGFSNLTSTLSGFNIPVGITQVIYTCYRCASEIYPLVVLRLLLLIPKFCDNYEMVIRIWMAGNGELCAASFTGTWLLLPGLTARVGWCLLGESDGQTLDWSIIQLEEDTITGMIRCKMAMLPESGCTRYYR